MNMLKQASKTLGFVAVSYAIGAVLFAGFVYTAITMENYERHKRLHS